MARIDGTNAGEVLNGTTGDDQIYGYGGNDMISGGAGNDILDGGTGSDNMTGGTGDDTYYVDMDFGDFVFEQPGEGTDRVYVLTASYVLPPNVENGTVYVTSGVQLTGNNLANILTGNSGNDTLVGLDGNDTLRGAGGNDTLSGGNGNDLLNGGLGIDSMAGGFGNDSYYVDDLADVVSEQGGQGTDRVYVLTSGYSLPTNVENGTVSLTSGATLTGNSVGNALAGSSGADILYGLGGNDTLNGGAGNDMLVGGVGNDSYYVDSLSDVVTEQPIEGTDRIYVLTSGYALPTNIENGIVLVASGATLTGNGVANSLIGNDGNDILYGLDGNDTLKGGAGNDTLVGGTGNDHYYVDSLADVVTEQPGEGTDRVHVQISGYVLPTDVEHGTVAIASGATLTGNSRANNLVGNSGDDILYGLDGNDRLEGGGGNDTLIGGAGKDTLNGGLGSDTIIGGLGIDAIDAIDVLLPGEHTIDTIVYQSVADAPAPSDPSHFWEVETVAVNTTNTAGGTHDVIDLSAIDANTTIEGDQAFTLVDSSTPWGAGQLYMYYQPDNTLLIYADVDGGGPDFGLLIHYTTDGHLPDILW